MTSDEAQKLPIKKLKHLLDERGLQCKGCAEKSDFVDLFIQHQHLPILEKNEEKVPKEKQKVDDKKIDEVTMLVNSVCFSDPLEVDGAAS